MRVRIPIRELDIPPRGVIFDLDHTLYDYDGPHERALAAVRDKATRTIGIDEKSFDRGFAEARADVKRRLGDTASAHSRLLYFQRLLEMVGMKSDVMAALDWDQTYWRTFLSTAKLFPGVEDLILTFRRYSVPITLVTDLNARIQFRKIIHFGLESLIDYVVTSEEVGADKPDAAIFRLALEKAGLEPEARIWVFGDDAVKDAAGAKLHLNAVVFLRRTGGAADGADVEFSGFTEIAPLVESACGMTYSDRP